MLFEWIDTEIPVQTFHLFFGLCLGALFGVAAQIARFCLRRAVAGDDGADKSVAAVWIFALATAIGSFQFASWVGWIDLTENRLLTTDLPYVAIIVGGLMFGIGMVLTRGCVSRLTVLMASGNLRAFGVLVIFAIIAHAAIKGVLAPLRVALGSITAPIPFASFSDVPGLTFAIPLLLLALAFKLAQSSKTSKSHFALGGFIGLIVTVGWFGTHTLLMDEFDPLPAQSLAFTLPWSETLFWTIASTSIPAGFGTGLIAGVLLGAGASAIIRGEFTLQSFEGPQQTVRYLSGGALMGVGGVLTGGCTIGAGLSGTAMLSVAATLALVSIISGGVMARYLLMVTNTDSLQHA